MKATTIKLEGELLTQIRSVKPADKSITSYVKEALQREINASILREAAERYNQLLESSASEKRAWEEWEAAPLERPIKKGKRR